ncbi:MAG: hypothetical protein Kow0022_03730 [Phycisphaerales bacterium]
MNIEHKPSDARDEAEIIRAYKSNPMVAVSLVDADGVILFVNGPSARIFLDSDDPQSCIGRSLYELFPKKWADERLRLFAEAERDGRCRVLRSIRRGRQIQSTITPLGSAQSAGKAHFLVVTVPGNHEVHGPDGAFEVVESEFADLGALDVLTRRELEVLALVKQGLTNQQIAGILRLSVKTVENHIHSITTKLQVSNRVQLAMIAQVAGLVLADAQLERL